jgi:predicted aspartyl protease
MKNLPLGLVVAAIVCFPTLTSQAAGSAAPAALKTFLEREGFGGSPLQRRFGNHLFVNTMMNGRRTALMIDSGCPITLIDRASARKLGLRVEETKSYIGGVTGQATRYGISKLTTLAMGNCTFVNVPVEIADEGQINLIARPHLDGLFGAHEMAKFGIIVDCARQMIYVNPKGPSAATTQKLAQFLAGRGFTRIPMHFNPEHHLEIDAALNGHPVRLIVDTGSAITLLSAPVAAASGTSLSPRFSFRGEAIGYVQQLALGNLIVNNAEVAVGNVAKMVGAGLLGEEYLSWNFAIVDVGGMNLYLRPPESAPRKNR